MGHSKRIEEVALERELVRQAGDLGHDFARRVEGDILVGPAGSGRANRIEHSQVAPQEARIHPFLELVVERIAIQAKAVRQQVRDRRALFVAARQFEVRGIFCDRRVEIDLALLGELGDHRCRNALRHRSPAEHGFGRYRIARTGVGFAIALEERDSAVFDHPDRQPDHSGPGDELPQPRIERCIIDVAPGRRKKRREPHMRGRDRIIVDDRRARLHRQQRSRHQQRAQTKADLLHVVQAAHTPTR